MDLLTTSSEDRVWLYHRIGTECTWDGKWLLYYLNKDIEEAWETAKENSLELYEAGIPAMKCAKLSYDNPRASDKVTKVIVFYCGPSSDEEQMKSIGRKLIHIMRYKSPTTNVIYYKTEGQTYSGTRATGSTVNHKYVLPVESLWPEASDPNEENPARELHQEMFYKTKPGWDHNISGLPSVRLHFSPDNVLEEWRRAKELLMAGSLVEECVAMDCQTMAGSVTKKKMQHRMKFYLDLRVSQREPVEMVNLTRDIYEKMESVEDRRIGLYEYGKRKPTVFFDLCT